jgi:hypothetical protein
VHAGHSSDIRKQPTPPCHHAARPPAGFLQVGTPDKGGHTATCPTHRDRHVAASTALTCLMHTSRVRTTGGCCCGSNTAAYRGEADRGSLTGRVLVCQPGDGLEPG